MKCLKRAKPQGIGRRALSKHAQEKGHENSTQKRKESYKVLNRADPLRRRAQEKKA